QRRVEDKQQDFKTPMPKFSTVGSEDIKYSITWIEGAVRGRRDPRRTKMKMQDPVSTGL
ncbi:hypothetical protein BGX28_004414, partial [Mortierella sp. GBA30]